MAEKPSKKVEGKKSKESALSAAPSLTDPLKILKDIKDPETADMLKKIQSMDNELKEKMEKLLDLSGHSSKEVETFLSNKEHFTDEFLKKIEKDESLLMQKLWGEEAAKMKKKRTDKKDTKLSTKRKKKSLGSRKNWIRMD